MHRITKWSLDLYSGFKCCTDTCKTNLAPGKSLPHHAGYEIGVEVNQLSWKSQKRRGVSSTEIFPVLYLAIRAGQASVLVRLKYSPNMYVKGEIVAWWIYSENPFLDVVISKRITNRFLFCICMDWRSNQHSCGSTPANAIHKLCDPQTGTAHPTP